MSALRVGDDGPSDSIASGAVRQPVERMGITPVDTVENPQSGLSRRVKCTRCGFMLQPVKRVMLMVEGRAMNVHDLCPECLSGVFDALQKPAS